MPTIVMNTRTGAVTRYDWPVQSVAGDHAAAADGLLALGGDTDAGEPITARAVTPATDLGSPLRKRLGDVHLSMRGPRGTVGQLVVQQVAYDEAGAEVIEEYAYPFAVRPAGVSRAVPGKGIRANRLALGFVNAEGADFLLDKIDADVIESALGRRLA